MPVLFCVRPVGRAVRMYLDLWSDCRCHAGGGVSCRLSVHAGCISTALPVKTDVATIWRGAGGGGSQISAEKRGPLRDNSSFWSSMERALLYQYSRARVWRGAELVGERGRWWLYFFMEKVAPS